MSVVYPDYDEGGGAGLPPESPLQRLGDWTQRHVLLSVVLVLGLALGIGLLINKLRGGTSTTTSAPESSDGAAISSPVGILPPTTITQQQDTTPPGSTILAQLRAKTSNDKGTGVPIYAYADTAAPVIGTPGFGGHVNLLSATPVNGFYEANYYGLTGYLSTKDVTGLSQ